MCDRGARGGVRARGSRRPGPCVVTAPAEIRTQRIAEARGADAAQAAKELKRSDEARAAYLKTFYGVERELPTHYDLVLNTETLEPDVAAEIVARAAA